MMLSAPYRRKNNRRRLFRCCNNNIYCCCGVVWMVYYLLLLCRKTANATIAIEKKKKRLGHHRHASGGSGGPPPPHILLLVTDQFRHDSWSHSPTKQKAPNDATAHTPHLDRIAKQGVRFSNAYASTPTCTPARAAILTGRSPWRHGMLGYYNDGVPCEKYPTTLPSALEEFGSYETFAAGKNHFGTHPGTASFVTQGYSHLEIYDGLTEEDDDYDKFFRNETSPTTDPLRTCGMSWNCWRGCPYGFKEELHPTAWTARKAVDYIEDFDFNGTITDDDNSNDPNNNNGTNKRMFLKVSFHRPHSPYDPPQRLYDKYTTMAGGVPSRTISGQWDQRYCADYTENTTMPDEAWKGDPGHGPARTSRASYLASIEFVDEGVGTVLRALERRGVLDDFFVVWIADHGDLNGDHCLWRKGYPSNKSAKIPMVMRWPQQGSVVGSTNAATTTKTQYVPTDSILPALVELRDVAPTIFDIANILDEVRKNDPGMDGESLLPLLRLVPYEDGRNNETKPMKKDVRNYLDLEHSRVYDDSIHWNAIVDKDTKYVFNAHDGSEMLFDLTADPDESNDLAPGAQHDPGVRARLGLWRGRLAEQFQREKRGKEWVTGDGALVENRKNIVLGPHYPCLHDINNNKQTARTRTKRKQ